MKLATSAESRARCWSIRDADGEVAPDTVNRINDHLAELVGRNSGRLYGLAIMDAFSGDVARET